jgi:hypothetical protein
MEASARLESVRTERSSPIADESARPLARVLATTSISAAFGPDASASVVRDRSLSRLACGGSAKPDAEIVEEALAVYLGAWRADGYELIVSPALLAEPAAVLERAIALSANADERTELERRLGARR